MKKIFYTEAAYPVALVILAFGTAFMEAADLGLSMVIAPAYLIYLKLSGIFSWVTFGMAVYSFQAILIILLSLVMKRFKRTYLFSFVTAFLFGNILDLVIKLTAWVPRETMFQRILLLLIGILFGSVGVALLFHTYLAPEAYELFVKEVSAGKCFSIPTAKTVYDCCSCLLAIILSFAFFGLFRFEGVKAGTVICALCNGFLIGKFSRLYDILFDFQDGLPLRQYFES